MPLSLGDWRVRIGTFLRRERKEYNYNYFLRKLLNLMKNTHNAKQPQSNIPECSTSSQTLLTNDANSSGDNTTHQNSSSVNVGTSQTNASQMPSGPSCGGNNPPGEATSKTCSTDSLRCNSVTKKRSPRDVEIPGYNPSPQLSCAENSGHTNAQKKDRTYVNTDDQTQVSQPFTKDHEKDYPQCLTSPASSGSAAASYPSVFEYQKNESFRPTFDNDSDGDDELDCREITIKSTYSTQLASLAKRDTSQESFSPSSRSLARGTSANDVSSGSHEESTLQEVELECQTVTPTTAKSGKIIKEIDVTEGNHCPGTTNILLLRAGDVESNPGPNETPGNLTELELYLLAECMDPSDFRKVGLALGFSEAQLSHFEKDQPNIMQATYQMLYEWRKRVHDGDARNTLVNQLEHLQLIKLADSLRRSQVGEDIPPLTEEEIQQVAEDVKRYFTIELCQIQADPLNSELLLQFERIFTNLTLMEEDKGTKKKTPLAYSDLLKTKVNGIYPKRLLVEGEGGVGKSTLCAKIAWDWMNGVCYKDFKLVLVILLRMAKDKTVGEIVKSYLSDNNPVTSKQLDKYILTHPDDVFLVLDGLDELAADLGSIQQLIQIILNRLFKSGTVLITSRQWRSDEIRNSPGLRKAFAFIAVEGFSSENLASYITKFFHPDTAASEELKRFISHNDVIRENMAPYPIYTAMLCIMWKEFDGERRKAMSKLKTFSQLFDEMIRFLIDHYLAKHFASPVNPSWMSNRSKILHHLTQIGCIAFQGLEKRQLVFSEVEFHNCPESVDTGCKVGVLTKEKRIPLRRETKNSVISSVQFPHKLFQEYLSGMYLASIYKSNRSAYDEAMDNILQVVKEYQYLLYFTSAQQKEVGLDIVSRLMDQRGRGYRIYIDESDRRKSWAIESFIVDVAYESQDQDVAKAVAYELFDEITPTLAIRNDMQAHTIAGNIFLVHHRQVERVTIEKSCGRTASEDLAEFLCSSPSLTSATIKATMHDVFYLMLAKKAAQSKIEILTVEGMEHSKRSSASRDHDDFYSFSMALSAKNETLDIQKMDLSERSSASRNLALFICKLPHAEFLSLGRYYGNESDEIALHDDFYSTASSMASSVMIKNLYIGRMDLRGRSSASRDLAKFICKMPHLMKLLLGNDVVLHDDFYSTASSMASSANIETFSIERNDLSEFSSASRDVAQFICKIPHLEKLTLGRVHDDFYSKASSMASSAKIETLDIQRIDLIKCSSASRDLAKFIHKMPHLKQLTLGRVHNDFYSTSSSMASSAKIETLDIQSMDLSQHSSASRGLAQFICKMPHLTLGAHYRDVMLHSDFYSTASSVAASAKIETLDIQRMDLSKCSSASRGLAQFICKMPQLKKLALGTSSKVVFHDNFYSTASSMASSAKIEILDIQRMDLSKRSSASRGLAQIVCNMPHLKKLILGTYQDCVLLHSDFYSTASSMASSAKIETLHIQRIDLSKHSSASRRLAQFICKMPHLKKLILGQFANEVVFHDDFYSTASSVASSAKIETLNLRKMDLYKRSSASRDLARFICKIPNLKNLKLCRVQDDFYSTASSMASSVKIETLDIKPVDLGERSPASRDLAQFICKLPHLKKLTLCTYSDAFLHDDFYLTTSSMASSVKIETLDIWSMNLRERSSASRDLAQFICKMPHLKNLTLNRVHDEFYSTASSMVSSVKTEILSIVWTDISERRFASHNLAHFICKMPYLKHLRLLSSGFHQDFWSKLLAASKRGEQEDDQVSNTSLTLTEMTVDDETLMKLQDRISMHESLKKVTLQALREIRSEVLLKIHLPGLTELIIQTPEHECNWPTKFKEEPSEISSAILSACPQLIKVTFSDLYIGNSKIKPILHAFSSAHHKHLKTISFIKCWTGERLDTFILEFNEDQIMKVEMEHGKPRKYELRLGDESDDLDGLDEPDGSDEPHESHESHGSHYESRESHESHGSHYESHESHGSNKRSCCLC